MPLRRYYFLILLYNFSIPGYHDSNHVIMNPDIFCLRIKVVVYMYLDNIVVKRFIKKLDL